MNYSDLITDFATRTLTNLDLVKDAVAQGNPDAYEVTQLWNSLLGLIVAPRETDMGRLPQTPLAKLYATGWPDITTKGQLEAETLRGLVGTLRHAVAHFNVEFHPDADGEIREVSLWNEKTLRGQPLPGRPHRWDGRVNVDELERLARLISATYLEHLRTRAA